jgi:hypothetical protein
VSYLKDNFNELLERIRHGRDFDHASFEPIYYLIFPPELMLDVKREMSAWTAKLRNDGWNVYQFSIAKEIIDILQNVPMRKIWLKAEANSPLDWEKTNGSLANALTNGSLQKRLEQKLSELEEEKNAILLVTDLEALHPYMRIGAIESQLQGKFSVPTVFFYPGERTGKTNLRFLKFYPNDGNYRSVHVGG